MEIGMLIAMIILLHVAMYYLRFIHFYRKPDNFSRLVSSDELMAPVEGRIVYVHLLESDGENNIILNKEGRKLEGPVLSPGKYIQIGIFMTPYNNHHMVKPIRSPLVSVKDMYTDLNSMMDTEDFIQPFGWWKNWFEKKYNKYLKTNRRTVFEFKNGIQLVLIYDKYVDKLTLLDKGASSNRETLGFVHRGSQVDIILPEDYVNDLFVVEGDVVKFQSLILTLNERAIP